MFSFFKKREATPQASGPVVLTATLEGAEICRITSGEVPAKKRPAVQLQSARPELVFTDSAGQTYAHDLSSVVADGLSWAHFDIRVSERFAAEADCLLSNSPDEKVAQQEFANHGKAIRFQPLYLPELPTDPTELIGKGFFFRGLHFPGTITTSNISLSCLCDHCRKSFRLECFHAGFMDVTYFFCNGGPHTLIVGRGAEDAPPLLQYSTPETVAPFEARLPPCEKCGGSFKYLNPFPCPHCLQPYIDFRTHFQLRMTEYYGCTLYGDSAQHWDG